MVHGRQKGRQRRTYANDSDANIASVSDDDDVRTNNDTCRRVGSITDDNDNDRDRDHHDHDNGVHAIGE